MRLVALLGDLILPQEVNGVEINQLRTYLRVANQSLIIFKEISDEKAKALAIEASKKNPEFGKLLTEFLISISINKVPKSNRRLVRINGKLTECLMESLSDDLFASDFSDRVPVAETGLSHSEYWSDFFTQIASVSDTLVVFDKYAGNQMVKYRNSSGLHNLLTYAISDGIKNFNIFTGDFESEMPNFEKRLSKELRNYSDLFSVEINLQIQNQKMFPHDRHMRFEIANKSFAYALGKGTEVFRGEYFLETFTITEIPAREAFSREKQIES